MSNKNEQTVGGFMFYRSFRDTIRQLPRRQQLALYDAIADYALDGTIPDIDNKVANVMWTLMQPSIDRTKKTDLSQPARRGAPVGNHNAAKHKPQPLAATVSPDTVAASPPKPQKVEYAAALQRLKASNEVSPLHREIAEIARDQSWIESVCMMFHLQPNQLTPYFSVFRLECETSGRIQHDNLNDCKQHFKSWLRIQINKRNKNEQSEQQQAKRRRIDVPPAETTDYHSSL